MRILMLIALGLVLALIAIAIMIGRQTPPAKTSGYGNMVYAQGSCTARPGGKCVRTRCKGRGCI